MRQIERDDRGLAACAIVDHHGLREQRLVCRLRPRRAGCPAPQRQAERRRDVYSGDAREHQAATGF